MLDETAIASRSPSRHAQRHRGRLLPSPVSVKQHLVVEKRHSSYSDSSDAPESKARRRNSIAIEKRHVIETDDGYVINLQTKSHRSNNLPIVNKTVVLDDKYLSLQPRRKTSASPDSV